MQEQKTYTKAEVSLQLGVQPYIITLWEKQFGIQITVSNGEELYSEFDAKRLASIKELLYEKGYSIAAAKQFLQEFPMAHETGIIAASPLLFESKKEHRNPSINSGFVDKLHELKAQLVKLRRALEE